MSVCCPHVCHRAVNTPAIVECRGTRGVRCVPAHHLDSAGPFLSRLQPWGLPTHLLSRHHRALSYPRPPECRIRSPCYGIYKTTYSVPVLSHEPIVLARRATFSQALDEKQQKTRCIFVFKIKVKVKNNVFTLFDAQEGSGESTGSKHSQNIYLL